MSPSHDHPDTPTVEEIETAAGILARLTPGFLPLPIFLQTVRLCTTPTIELVPLRNSDGGTEILLLNRPDDDPFWPSQPHVPGTVIRPTDVGNDFNQPFQRLYDDELKLRPTSVPQPVGQVLETVARGAELAIIFYIDLTDMAVTVGKWYPVTSLPDSLIETQRGRIAQAIQAFEGGR